MLRCRRLLLRLPGRRCLLAVTSSATSMLPRGGGVEWARPISSTSTNAAATTNAAAAASTATTSRANALRQALQASVAEAGAAEEPLLAVYDRLVHEGQLRADLQQRRVARRLDRLAVLLKDYTPPIVLRVAEEKAREKLAAAAAAAAAGPRLQAQGQGAVAASAPGQAVEGQSGEQQQATPTAAATEPLPPPSPPPPPPRPTVLRGMYIHGEVGTGKSLLMDLFFHHCPLRAKRRVHFHEFMLEVHARIHAWKQRALATEGRARHIDLRPERNAIVQVARAVAAEAHLLCFDEFQVTDVADALIMASLFHELWAQGVVVLATSNRAPDELYLDGLNRPYFLPFLDLLRRQCLVVDMDSGVDHRRKFRAALAESCFTPLDGAAAAKLEAAFLELTDQLLGDPQTIPVMMGRSLRVPRAYKGVCAFAFGDLCRADVFAADYHAVCAHYHTVVLEGVPTLSTEKHNEARRFITLVDVLYETRTRLVMSAAAPVQDLFHEPSRVSGSAGAFDGSGFPSLEPLKTAAPSTTGHREGAAAAAAATTYAGTTFTNEDKKEEVGVDSLVQRYADAAQELVVPEGELASVKELAFAFQRAASRLLEMASEEYIAAHEETRIPEWEAAKRGKGKGGRGVLNVK